MSKNTLSALEQANNRVVQRSINTLRIASAVKEGEQLSINAVLVLVAKYSGLYVPPAGSIAVDVSAAASPAAGTGVLTSDNTNITDGDTVTIGRIATANQPATTIVYRFKDTPAQAYDVKRDASTADTSLGNLVKAINASGVAGTDYFAGTLAHPDVSAGAVTSHATTLTAKAKGTVFAGLVITTEASSHLSFGAGTLAGGTDVSAADFTTALVAVSHLPLPVGLTRISANEVLFENLNGPEAWTATETFSGSNNAWANATFYGGNAPEEFAAARLTNRVPNAQEIALGDMHFLFKFNPVAVIVIIRTSAGVLKAHDGAVTITGKRVTIDNSGSTDFAANDVVTVLASE